MWAPVLSFSSRMISYPCFPPLLRRERTNRSRKLFTIRLLTALVILSRELLGFDNIGFQYKPLLRGYRTAFTRSGWVEREPFRGYSAPNATPSIQGARFFRSVQSVMGYWIQ